MQQGRKEGAAQTNATVETCAETNDNFRVALAKPEGLSGIKQGLKLTFILPILIRSIHKTITYYQRPNSVAQMLQYYGLGD